MDDYGRVSTVLPTYDAVGVGAGDDDDPARPARRLDPDRSVS